MGKEQLKIFENKKIRTAWDEELQEWFFPLLMWWEY